MDSLFDQVETNRFEPLAVRMRPTSLDHFYGQEKAVGKGSFLRAMVEQDTIPSMLFYGPSGTGKTTLAGIIAKVSHSRFVQLNATNTGIGELRSMIEEAHKYIRSFQQRTILFLDEIHRFNKSQQDVLLPCVEDGTIVLIGATTENPFFEVNRALLSRLRLITLEALTPEAIAKVLHRALTDTDVGLGDKRVQADQEVLLSIGVFVNGDARMSLNILEQAVAMVEPG
ncbi:MAG: AAA family ATPase, partial [Veillonella sp.]|nr:AAA family ATPase [Veillonella sp.]